MSATQEATSARSWAVLGLLSVAQFVMVIDSTVMNVSIADLVADLNTTVTAIQAAVTLFTLVMASSMIIGGKLGDIWGRRNAFRIGLIVYGIGSGLTAIAGDVRMLYLGWSLVEGLGAALIMPTISALVASNFRGAQRATAYGMIAAAASAAMTLGPLIGGWVTTSFSWRYVFAAETVTCVAILALAGLIADAPSAQRPRFDGVGAALSATGLAAIVFAVLLSSEWGWVTPSDGAPQLLGISATLWLLLGGGALLWLFGLWQVRRVRVGASPLVSPELFGNRQLVGGLIVLAMQMFVMGGVMFALPLFLSIALGLSAFQTGLTVFPLSVGLLLTAVVGGRLLMERGRGPRAIVRLGFVAILVGVVFLIGAIQVDAVSSDVLLPLFVVGLGMGLLAGQLGNVIQSAVPIERASEAGGLQFTAQNIGTSLGTALVGALLISGLATSVLSQVQASPHFSATQKQEAGVKLTGGVQFVSDEQLKTSMEAGGATAEEVDAAVAINAKGRVAALRRANAMLALLTLAALFTTAMLPERLDAQASSPMAATG
jgi:MFS family permease